MKTDIQPYRVQPSRRTVSEITDQYNDALYRSYGPDHSLKSGPVQLTVDALCEYERLLDTIVEMGAEGAPLAEMHDQPCPPDKIICGIRHDLDMDFRASLDMARLEQERGIRSSWYILHTAPYYGQLDESGVFHRNESMASVYLQLQEMGHEVGLHIDPLHLYQNEKINGAEALIAELEWMRSIGLNVIGSAAHNMVSTYNAENFAIYKGRPLSGGELKGEPPTEVVKDGKWAPVGIVDEAELGLTYEANDLFHQGHSSVYYAAIRGLDRWRRVEEMSAPRAGKRDDLTKGFTDTATVLNELRAVERGRFVILAIHPIYYGARHNNSTGPSRFCSINGSACQTPSGWMTYPAGKVQARCGKLEDGRQEFQSINLANERGQLDFPFKKGDEKADLRVLILGSRNLDGVSVGLPAQMHVRMREELESEKDAGAVQVWKFARPEMGVSRWISEYESLKKECSPTHLVLGLGSDELLRSLPEYWHMVCGSDPQVPPGGYLCADLKGGISKVSAGRGSSVLQSIPQRIPEDAPLFHRPSIDRHGKAAGKLEALLRYWKETCEKDGVELILFLENCGEAVDAELMSDSTVFENAHRKTRVLLGEMAERLGITFNDPYPALLKEQKDAFYQSVPEWSPRGHAVAGGVLAKTLKQFRGEFAKFSSTRRARVRSARSLATDSKPTEIELEHMEAVAVKAGVRPIPYPFDNALTVTSDIDKSNREKYHGYIGALVRDFGLDFGDSVWLTASFSGGKRSQRHTGMAFFTPWMTHFERVWPNAQVLDSLELAKEHHLGNIDHWHSFLRRGPRFALAKILETPKNNVVRGRMPAIADPRPPSDHKSGRDYYDTRDFYVLAVTVTGNWSGKETPEYVTVTSKGGEDAITLLPGNDPLDELPNLQDSHRCFVAKIDPEDKRIVPHLDEVEYVSVHFEGSASRVNRIILHNTHPDLFDARLDYLAEQFHFSTNLVTRHSLFHFLPAIPGFGGNGQGRANVQRMENQPDVLDTYYGSLFDLGIPASTSADEPGSFAKLYPQQTTKNGLRFLRTAAIDYPVTLRTAAATTAQALRGKKEDREKRGTSDPVESETTGWHPGIFGVTFPMPTRYGGCLYHLRSTHSRLADKDAAKSSGKALAKKTIARNFTNRLSSVIEDLRGKKGRAAQFYTHLGNLAPDDNTLPDPYFDQGDLRQFQDRVFGCGEDQSHRIWFTRGSVLSDFSLVLQSIGHHLTRPDKNTVSIESWVDPYLGVKVGESACQLYGQTFYVEDSSRASVSLDGRLIDEISRNPADETGKQSVTIVASPIRHTVFRAIGPAGQTGGTESSHLDVKFENSTLALKTNSSETGVFRFFPESLEPVGAQNFTFRMCGDEGTSFAIVLETESGGRFAFGNASGLKVLEGEIDATYTFPGNRDADGEWITCVVPFHDLLWSDRAKGFAPGEIRPIPSHQPRSVSVYVQGGKIELAALEYTRPRTTRPQTASPNTVKPGGRVSEKRRSETFQLRSITDDQVIAETAPNDVGHLIFAAVPRDGYRLCSATDPSATIQWVEAFSDRFDLEIS